ncbi:MAG: HlyD family secretion protein [Weeksellaceae bacterium]|nr:HlyD family secretion protein [Weeksellaceae bacterium]
MAQDNIQFEQGEIPLKKKRGPVFYIILGVLILAGVFFGVRQYQYSQAHEETDDAQIAADVSPVISKISGYISEVKVKDNQFVKQGDTLVILDNRDQKMALAQAEAALGTAKSNVSSAKAGSQAAASVIGNSKAAVQTANAQIEAAKVNLWRTEQDMKRYSELVKDHSITQQQYEQAAAAYQTAQKQLQVLADQKNQANVQTSVVTSQSNATYQNIGIANATLKQRRVDVENAKLNLTYTAIIAKENGYVSKIPVQVGQFVQAGSQLFSVVLSNQKWIVANYKETQVEKMVEGQKVEIKIDAYPGQQFEGTIASFSPATGSTFSLLPPDNASGNFVKVVQRLPVKITFKNMSPDIMKKLRVGMNVKTVVSLKN